MSEDTFLFQAERFRVVRARRELSDGSHVTREVVRHPGAVAILPLLDADRVCLIRNYRISIDQTLWEIPAGTRDPNEEPIETARRELLEETGYRAGRLELLNCIHTSPGILDELMHCFVATELEPGQAAPEPYERIEPVAVAWRDALEMIRDGRIRDAKTIAVLLYYDAFRRCKG